MLASKALAQQQGGSAALKALAFLYGETSRDGGLEACAEASQQQQQQPRRYSTAPTRSLLASTSQAARETASTAGAAASVQTEALTAQLPASRLPSATVPDAPRAPSGTADGVFEAASGTNVASSHAPSAAQPGTQSIAIEGATGAVVACKLDVATSVCQSAHNAPATFAGSCAGPWAAALANVEPFLGHSQDLLSDLLPFFRYAALPAGTQVLKAGVAPPAALIILSGSVELTDINSGTTASQKSGTAAAASSAAAASAASVSRVFIGAGWVLGGTAFARATAADASAVVPVATGAHAPAATPAPVDTPVDAPARADASSAVSHGAPLVAMVLLRSDYQRALWRWGCQALLATSALGVALLRLRHAQRVDALSHVGLTHVPPGTVLCLQGQRERIAAAVVTGRAIACVAEDSTSEQQQQPAVGSAADMALHTRPLCANPSAEEAQAQQSLAQNGLKKLCTILPRELVGADSLQGNKHLSGCGAQLNNRASVMMATWGTVALVDTEGVRTVMQESGAAAEHFKLVGAVPLPRVWWMNSQRLHRLFCMMGAYIVAGHDHWSGLQPRILCVAHADLWSGKLATGSDACTGSGHDRAATIGRHRAVCAWLQTFCPQSSSTQQTHNPSVKTRVSGSVLGLLEVLNMPPVARSTADVRYACAALGQHTLFWCVTGCCRACQFCFLPFVDLESVQQTWIVSPLYEAQLQNFQHNSPLFVTVPDFNVCAVQVAAMACSPRLGITRHAVARPLRQRSTATPLLLRALWSLLQGGATTSATFFHIRCSS